MKRSLLNSPENRAYEVFRSLFDSEEDLAAWLWAYKDNIVPDCIYHDGTDGFPKEYVESIQTEDLKTGEITVFGGMPSVITVSGIGTHQERAEISWMSPADNPSKKPTELRESQVRVYERTLADYQKWAKANGIKSRMPIMKK
ncbi:MAG TPA: hypothetical protein VIF82_04120 [Burkholderiaceae bacterium]|jgi:hypothetical protein